jgi:hypothetical protein
MNVYEKLANVQSALKAPKGQYNSFGKYKYRSCEDIVESVKPLLKQNGLLLTLNDELVLVGDRFYVKATATIIDTAEGKTVSVHAFAREEETKKGMDGSQVTGASSSYARKYALNGIFAIDDTKDSDSTNTHGQEGYQQETPKEQPKPKNVLPPRDQLIARLKELNINVKAYAAANNITPETTDEGYLKCLRELRNA